MAGVRRRSVVGAFPVGSWGRLGEPPVLQLDLAAQESGPDTFAGEAAVLVQVALAAQDLPDIFSGEVSALPALQADLAVQEGAEKDELVAQLQAQVAILQAQLAAASGAGGAFGGPDRWESKAERIDRNNRLVMALVGSVVGGFGRGDK